MRTSFWQKPTMHSRQAVPFFDIKAMNRLPYRPWKEGISMPENVKFRYYLFGSDRVWKVPTRMLGRMVLPQYAGTKQKILDVQYWYEGGAIKAELKPSLMAFDAEGRWDRAYSVQGGMAVLEAAEITARAKRTTVVALEPVIDANKRKEAHRWKPTQAEIDRVMLDL